MDSLRLAHLVLLGLWGGLVAGELVVELVSRTEDELRHAARLHYWMDLVVELPLLTMVLLTGVMLAGRAWPLSVLQWAKIGAGLVAVGANLWCVVHVITRYRQRGDVESLRRHGRWVRVTALVGVPFGAVAAYIGLEYLAR